MATPRLTVFRVEYLPESALPSTIERKADIAAPSLQAALDWIRAERPKWKVNAIEQSVDLDGFTLIEDGWPRCSPPRPAR